MCHFLLKYQRECRLSANFFVSLPNKIIKDGKKKDIIH